MSLSHGRHYLAIPGPSVIPDRVLNAMHRAAPNIYSDDLSTMAATLVGDLKAVARTRHNVALYITNGHGAWEAALTNTHSRGDRVLVLVTGSFCIGWSEVAERLGIDCELLDFGKSSDVDMTRLAQALEADKDHSYKSVLVVQVDTASTVKNDIAGIRATLDVAQHPALLMVDCIASLASDRFEMDAWGVDLMVAASQKGLMTPPGLGFIFFNDKAGAARGRADLATHYWDWRLRANPQEFYQYFDGTAPTHHLYGLREALTMIAEEGLENVWDRHAKLSAAVWAACQAWGSDGPLKLNITDPGKRSCAVTSVHIGAPVGTQLRTWLTQKAGVTLGIGLGMADSDDPAWHGYFRIAHMGHVNTHMVLGALGAIEAGMIALDIPHGPGALSAAAKVCSTA